MKTIIHAMFGSISFLLILIFTLTSLASEIWYDGDFIRELRSLIFSGMLLLMPVLCITALLGISLGKERKEKILISQKKKRMFWIFVIYSLVFLPTAYLLEQLSKAEKFNSTYLMVQLIEYVFDLIALVMLALNFRDGTRLVTSEIERSNQEFSRRVGRHE